MEQVTREFVNYLALQQDMTLTWDELVGQAEVWLKENGIDLDGEVYYA